MCEIFLFSGTRTAVAGSTAMMLDFFGLDERAVAVSHMVPFPQRAAVWGALYGPLPGYLQGSDRAEVWALLQLLERTLGGLVIGTDCDLPGQVLS